MATLSIDVDELVQFLKKNQKGPEVVQALRLRAAIHFLDPSLDPLSSRMLKAYGRLCEIVCEPFTILDAGCMSGYLNHFMKQRLSNFSYTGIDPWEEALKVAREFQPGIDVRPIDINGEIPKMSALPNGRVQAGWDYVWLSNIVFDDPKAVYDKLLPFARRALIIAQPPWAGEYPGERLQCGETTIYMTTK